MSPALQHTFQKGRNALRLVANKLPAFKNFLFSTLLILGNAAAAEVFVLCNGVVGLLPSVLIVRTQGKCVEGLLG